ncbi:MAG: hypothetical protein ACP5I1_17165, partial [Candidatus Hinthialibacter sp.]
NSVVKTGMLIVTLCISFPAMAQVGIFDKQADWGPRGAAKAEGEAILEGDVYILSGNGDDIWNNDDEGFFVYTEKSGSWSISGQVSWIDPGTNDWSKIGVMIREKGDLAESKHFWTLLRGALYGDRADAAWRSTEGGGSASSQMFEVFPDGEQLAVEATVDGLYLRVSRIADLNRFYAEWSYDGVEWNLWHSEEIEMQETVAYGLAITNHEDDEALAIAEVKDVKIEAPPTLPETASRVFSSGGYMQGDTIDVTISILNPNENTSTVSIRETVPDGWTISDVSDGGAVSGQSISWNFSAAHGYSQLTYKVTADSPGEDNNFEGTIRERAISGSASLAKVQPAPEGDQIFDQHADIYDDPANVGVDADGNPILGSATYDPQTNIYEIQGGGNDIWGNADNFHFLYTTVSGDFVMECNIEHDESERSTSTDGWIKGMMMARQNLTPGSPNFGTRVRRDGQYSWQMRSTQDGSSTSDGNNRVTFTSIGYTTDAFPRMRLERAGDNWSIYYRDELGTGDWIQVQTTQTLVLEDPILVGLAVTAHQVGSVQYTWFKDVTLEAVTKVEYWMILE